MDPSPIPSLDPDVAPLIEFVDQLIDVGSWTLETIASERDAFAQIAIEPPATTTVSHEVEIAAGDGAHRPHVRVYSPPTAATGRACILWIHGGGYMFGSGVGVDARLNRWVETLDCVAVSVDYRLAPEDPFPAPLDDCYAALRWAKEHADELGVDVERIAVVGASAGGGLAAALAILARDRGEVALCFQALIYPMIDDRNTHPQGETPGPPIWSRAANQLGWRSYLGDEPGGADVSAYAAASRVEAVHGLPPTWIGVGAIDLFLEENIDYATRLLAAGIPTELHVYAGAPHGFEMIAADAPVSQRFQADLTAALERALRAPE